MRVIAVSTRERRRTAVDRVLMLAPWLFRRPAALVFRLPPGHTVRTAALEDVVARSFASLARGDLELIGRLYHHPDSVPRSGEHPGPGHEMVHEGRSWDAALAR